MLGKDYIFAPRPGDTTGLRRMSVWLLVMLLCTHVVHVVSSAAVGVKPMVISGAAGLLCYCVLIALLTSSRMPLWAANIVSLAEIVTHMTGALMCIGWQSGFAMYCMALVSVVFFWSRAAERRERRFHHPVVSSICFVALYFALDFYCSRKLPLYHIPDLWLKFFFVLNSAITFALIMAFAKVYTDAIERIERACRMESNIDELTGLYNRRKVREILGAVHDAAINGGKPYTVAMLDLDGFKQINDTHGHNAGDYVLKTVAQKLLAHVSGGRDDAKACRWGGDEFLIIGTPTREHAEPILEAFRRDVEQTDFHHEGAHFPLTVSIGVAVYTENSTISQVVGRADSALYQAKHAGKNKVCWPQ